MAPRVAELAERVAELAERVAKLEAEAERRRVSDRITKAMSAEPIPSAPPPPKT